MGVRGIRQCPGSVPAVAAVFYGIKPAVTAFALGGGHAAGAASYGPALIDDDTPTPPHARFRRIRLLRMLGAGLGLWLLSMAALVASAGWDGTLTRMAWFFSKAAMLTFGGAYAVLPYVYQGAVEQQQRLTGPQMMDGLALRQTTLGPLIMVVAFMGFLGFLGGWLHQMAGPGALLLSGALAAAAAGLLVAWVPTLLH